MGCPSASSSSKHIKSPETIPYEANVFSFSVRASFLFNVIENLVSGLQNEKVRKHKDCTWVTAHRGKVRNAYCILQQYYAMSFKPLIIKHILKEEWRKKIQYLITFFSKHILSSCSRLVGITSLTATVYKTVTKESKQVPSKIEGITPGKTSFK